MEYGILQDDDDQQEFIYSKKLRKKVPIEKANEEVQAVSEALNDKNILCWSSDINIKVGT